MVNFNAGNDMNITVHGNQTINEYTITINSELRKELQPEFEAAHIPEPIQEELVESSQELVEAFRDQEPSKFQRLITAIKEKGPEVADVVLAKVFEVAMKTVMGGLVL